MASIPIRVPYPPAQRLPLGHRGHTANAQTRFDETVTGLVAATGAEVGDTTRPRWPRPASVVLKVPDDRRIEAEAEAAAYMARTYVSPREFLMKTDEVAEGIAAVLSFFAMLFRGDPVLGPGFAVAAGISEIVDDVPDAGLAALKGQPQEVKDAVMIIVEGVESMIEKDDDEPALAAVPPNLSARLRDRL